MTQPGVRADDWRALAGGWPVIRIRIRIVRPVPDGHGHGRFGGAALTPSRGRSHPILPRALCQTWGSEAAARRHATLLEGAGWRVDWREPPAQFGPDGPWTVASVSNPDTLAPLGEVSFALEGEAVGDIISLDDTDWEPSGPGERLRIQVVWVRETPDPDWLEVGGYRYWAVDEDITWDQVQVRATALPGGWR